MPLPFPLPCLPHPVDKQDSKEKICGPSEESPSESVLCSDEIQDLKQSGKDVRAPLACGD